jgi:hypothetical protein
MCKYLGNEPGQLHGRITLSLIEEHRQSMAQHLPQQTAVEVPAILGPHSLDLVSVHQLPKGGVIAIPDSTEQSTALGPRITGGFAERRFQLQSSLRQLCLEGRTPVVAVSHPLSLGYQPPTQERPPFQEHWLVPPQSG